MFSRLLFAVLAWTLMPVSGADSSVEPAARNPHKDLPRSGEVFRVADRTAFLIPAKAGAGAGSKAWVWYAPTLPGLPGTEEGFMFDRFLQAGISIAGVDVGESFGSPDGRQGFDALYAEMTVGRGYSRKPVLLGRSRGGLMTLSWAAENPEKVGGFAGIYPVCNLVSYPGLAKAASAYRMTPEELGTHLREHNPVDRLAGLARAGVPLFAIHGDVDTVVPLEANSGLVRERYEALGGSMQVIVPTGQGHNMWSGFFESSELVTFVLRHAVPGVSTPPACRVDVVEKGSGDPVPMVELRTTHQIRYVSDNAGRIAVDAPELMGRETWFEVVGHGYEIPKDGFGYRGVRLKPQEGGSLRVEVVRTSLAKRIGRLTGAGIFAESQKLGLERDWREQGVFGCDSVQNAVHEGRLFWVWGDTTLSGYPLGIFDALGASTSVAEGTAWSAPLRVRFDYVEKAPGVPRGVAPMPGEGPTWLTGLVSLPTARGAARLVASYMKIRPPLEAYEWGLCVWDEAARRFEPLRVVWRKSDGVPERPPCPDGHAARWKDGEGREWVLFGNPFPSLRCRATYEAWSDPGSWEAMTPQSGVPLAKGVGAAGNSEVKPHSGSIAWHPGRGRWVAVFTEAFGKPSAFGEVWYAEAEAPQGPWRGAVKILSHENYTFYNPRVHAESLKAGSGSLYFEGTFSSQFSDHAVPVARHDYNQVLYRLDLDGMELKQ